MAAFCTCESRWPWIVGRSCPTLLACLDVPVAVLKAVPLGCYSLSRPWQVVLGVGMWPSLGYSARFLGLRHCRQTTRAAKPQHVANRMAMARRGHGDAKIHGGSSAMPAGLANTSSSLTATVRFTPASCKVSSRSTSTSVSLAESNLENVMTSSPNSKFFRI